MVRERGREKRRDGIEERNKLEDQKGGGWRKLGAGRVLIIGKKSQCRGDEEENSK